MKFRVQGVNADIFFLFNYLSFFFLLGLLYYSDLED